MSERQPQAVLAEVLLLQCMDRRRLCAARLRSQFPAGLVKFSTADVPRSSAGQPGVPDKSRLVGIRRILRTLSSSTESLLVFIMDSAGDSLEDSVAVAAMARELALGRCAVLCFDGSSDGLDTPHSVEGIIGPEQGGADGEPVVHRAVARPFAPQQEEQATSFFADCARRPLGTLLQLEICTSGAIRVSSNI